MLYSFEIRVTVVEQEKRKVEEENMALYLVHMSVVEFQVAIDVEIKTPWEAMVVDYEEMSKLHHTVATIMTIQAHTKVRVTMLKGAMTTFDKIHEWSVKYPGAPMMVPKKDWIPMQNTKVQLRIKIQSKENLMKDVDTVFISYRQLLSDLESIIQIHGVPSKGEVRQMRNQDGISKEV